MTACGGGSTGGDTPSPTPAKAKLDLQTAIPDYSKVNQDVFFNADIKNEAPVRQDLKAGANAALDIIVEDIHYPSASGVTFSQINQGQQGACAKGQSLSVNESCKLALKVSGQSENLQLKEPIAIKVSSEDKALEIPTNIEFVNDASDKLSAMLVQGPVSIQAGSKVQFIVTNPKDDTQPLNNIAVKLNLPQEFLPYISDEKLSLMDSLNAGEQYIFSFQLANDPEVTRLLKDPVIAQEFYVVEDRAPRVYPWVNERDGGMLYA